MSVPGPKHHADVPYEAATVPLPSAAASGSKINVSPTSNIKRYVRGNTYDDVPCMQHACHGPTQCTILSQHSISDFVRAQTCPGSQRDDQDWRGSEDVHFGDRDSDGVDDVSSAGDDVAAGLEAAVGGPSSQMKRLMGVLGSHALHRSPYSSNQSTTLIQTNSDSRWHTHRLWHRIHSVTCVGMKRGRQNGRPVGSDTALVSPEHSIMLLDHGRSPHVRQWPSWRRSRSQGGSLLWLSAT